MPKISFILILIGIASFIGSLTVWAWFYPRRKRFLEQLRKEFRFEYPKGALTLRRAKLKGVYQDHEIIIVPFVSEEKLWVLVKFSNPKDFLASIKPRKPEMFWSELVTKKGREELLIGNLTFDKQFKVLGRANLEINKILPPSIQKRLIQLVEKETFEIQILHDGIFYSSESKTQEVGLVKFILDLLVEMAENISHL